MGGTNLPWTFGQAFADGDVPAGSVVTVAGEQIQCVVKNRWPSGAAKFAILSGRTSLTAGVRKDLQLQVGAQSGALIQLSQLQALNPSVSLQLGSIGTVTLASLLTQTSTGKGVPGLVRQWVSGPQMSEWHFYSPVGSDQHLAVFFHVRLYAGNEIEIETIVDNGYLTVASPGARSYTATLTINGSVRFNSALTHLHHTRWSRADWYTENPQIVPRHDPVYLRRTKLVPNYGFTNATSAAWSNNGSPTGWDAPINSENPAPFAQGNASPNMGEPGYHESIGLLPRWDALYCTTGDPRSYRSVVGNARCWGRYSLIYRDERTNRPLRFSQHPNLVVNDANNGWKYGTGGSSTGTYTPVPSGGVVTFTHTHMHAPPYLAYLLTGRYGFIEQAQFISTAIFLANNDTTRQFGAGVIRTTAGANAVRGAAWALRSLAMALCITPDEDATTQAEFANSWAANTAFYRATYTSFGSGSWVNSFGLVGMAFAGNEDSPWQQSFFGASIGLAWDMGLPQSTQSRTDHQRVRDHCYVHAVGFAGSGAGSEMSYRRVANYMWRYLVSTSGPSFFSSWNAMMVQNEIDAGLTPIQNQPGTTLKQHSSDADMTGADSSSWPVGYLGNMVPALSYAVDHQAPGASAGLARLQASPSWNLSLSVLHDNPIWGVLPR